MKLRALYILNKVMICIVLTMVFGGCGQRDYKGDGTLDTAFFFYPKFKVTFSELPINTPIKKLYRFRGTPDDELILRFDILREDRKRETDYKQLTLLWKDLNKAKIVIKVVLAIGDSKVRSVGPALLTEAWTLAAFGKEYYFWHKDFNKLLLNKKAEYKLNIEVDVKGNLRQKVFLVPILEGGGFGKGDIYRS